VTRSIYRITHMYVLTDWAAII